MKIAESSFMSMFVVAIIVRNGVVLCVCTKNTHTFHVLDFKDPISSVIQFDSLAERNGVAKIVSLRYFFFYRWCIENQIILVHQIFYTHRCS